jgi:hypothetical protein
MNRTAAAFDVPRFTGWLGYATGVAPHERFCTHRCEAAFARAAYRAGYRIQRTTPKPPTPRKDTKQ